MWKCADDLWISLRRAGGCSCNSCRTCICCRMDLTSATETNESLSNGWDLKPEKNYIVPILSIGIPSGLENGMFQIGKLCVSSLTSTLGTAAIEANAVANTVTTVANIPGNAMNLAIIPVVSRCLGAGDKKQAKHYAKCLLGIAACGFVIVRSFFRS